MPVTLIHPTIDVSPFLPGAQFSDAFSIITDDAMLDARRAAERMFSRQPRWIAALMRLRDAIVGPLGLKTERVARRAQNRVGFFPVISETPQRLVAGLDDSHQDFRVVVDVTPLGTRCRVTVTTIVKTHNIYGRAYLAAIMPFHIVIVRAMLRQVAI
jgi:hypothetical protein